MFDTLTERLTQSLRNVTGSGQLTEDNIKDTLREVRIDRKSTRLNSSHLKLSRMPSSA